MGKEGAFLAANAAPDLHNHIFFVIGVLGQQQNFQLSSNLASVSLGGLKLLLTELLHVRVCLPGQQLPGLLLLLLGLTEGRVRLCNGLQLISFLQQLGGRAGSA